MTTGTATKRTKSGCWTCRLRRKKCNEGGPPCDNCEARGVHCHGYGPKPQWKDRGSLEREEARKLQYQSGRARSFPKSSITEAIPAPATPMHPEVGTVLGDGVSGGGLNLAQKAHNHGHHGAISFPPITSGFDLDYMTITAADMSPLLPDIGLSLDTHVTDPLDFEFVSSPSDCAVDRASSDSTDSTSHLDWSQFPIFSPELPVVTPLALSPPVPVPSRPPDSTAGSETVPATPFSDFFAVRGRLLPESNHSVGQIHGQVMIECEKGIELMMRFLADLCSGEISKGTQISEMGWLLLLLTRSSAFCYTTLSLTSYRRYLVQSADSTSRAKSFTDYQNYRSQALRHLSNTMPGITTSQGGGQSSRSPHSSLCERLVCSVQLAHLEATSGNIQECQNHIDAAARLLLEHETALVTEAYRLTDMERKALTFFTARLIWNDVILSSIRRTIPKAEKVYRRLLLAEATNNREQETTRVLATTSTFRDLIGCDNAVLLALLDASVLGAWRLSEEAAGSLSIRALVGRAGKIEAAVEDEIARLSRLLPPAEGNSSSPSSSGGQSTKAVETGRDHLDTVVQSLIFAHAVLTDLHQIVSGPRSSVPEIVESISRAISSAWSLRRKQHNKANGLNRILAWPFCVAASLAKGDQRDLFRDIIVTSEKGDQPTSSGDVQQLKSIVEQCWAFTTSSSGRDWRDVVQRSNQFSVFLI